ncbi:MAG: UvrD-helicase domain-containing protein [Defluviitaleaceae bacterium]|nr:UvrD-helicase domain-containing protein [Defluviitaleaceae bacterium]
MTDILSALNDSQISAVTATEGFLRIVAGAGSGKTKALTHRYAYLVKNGGIQPRNILCVTFTNKAAGEMKRRVRQMVGDGYDTALITTYHGFCVRVLRPDMDKLFYPENFLILDIGDQKKILEEIYETLELKLDYASFQKTLKKISLFKADTGYVPQLVDPTHAIGPENTASLDETVIKMYLKQQKKVFGLDFDDLVNFTFYLFGKFPEVLEKWRDQLHYIQVDEFQDSSNREMRLLDMLCGKHKNLFVVGDPDQNIYEWRGARVEIFVDFDKTHVPAKTVILDRNYRSTPQVLDAANCLISKNQMRIKKDLFTKNTAGMPVIHLHARDEKAEAEWIADEIKKTVKNGGKYSDCSVLYRAVYLSRNIEQALVNGNVPYQIWGGVRFFDRMEIRDMIAYMRLVAFKDDLSFLRVINVPRRQMGKNRIAYIKACAEEENCCLYDSLLAHVHDTPLRNTDALAFVEMTEHFRDTAFSSGPPPPSEILQQLMEKSGYERYIREAGDMERLDNLAELQKTVVEYERSYGETLSLTEFLKQLALLHDENNLEESRDCVRLMTIHTAKGLEFPNVFITGLTEGVFPSSRTLEERKAAGLEEERRLCFVAMTRAKERLYMTESEGFGNGGAKKLPSRFLFDIDENLYERIGVIPQDLINEMRKKLPPSAAAQKNRMVLGERVNHPLFGEGTIQSIDESAGVYQILFDNGNKTKPIGVDFDFKGASKPQDGLPYETVPAKNVFNIEPEAANDMPPPIPKTAAPKQKKTNANNFDQISLDEAKIFGEIEKTDESGFDSLNEYANENIFDYGLKPAYEKYEAADDTEDTIDTKNSENDFNISSEQTANVISEAKLEKPVRKYSARELTDDRNETNLWKRSDVPHTGWSCTDVIDLGAPNGTCGMCGYQIIRYVHMMEHPNYPRRIGAGCVCAGGMEGDKEGAAQRERDFKNRTARLVKYMAKPWKKSKKGNKFTKYKGQVIVLLPDKFRDGFWKYMIDGSLSLLFNSEEDAKRGAFDEIESLQKGR